MALTRRDFVGGLLGGGGLLAVACAGEPPSSESPTPPTSTTTTTSTTTAVVATPDYVSSAEWETVSAAEVGWNESGLDEAMAFAESRATKALLLLHGGRILAERYVGVGSCTCASHMSSVGA